MFDAPDALPGDLASLVLAPGDAWVARLVCRAWRDACARPACARASTAVTSVERLRVAMQCRLAPAAACRAAAASGALDVLRWATTVERLESVPADCVLAAARGGHVSVVRWMHARLKVPTWRAMRPPVSARRLAGLTARLACIPFGFVVPMVLYEQALLDPLLAAPCVARALLVVLGSVVAVGGVARYCRPPDATRASATLRGLGTGLAVGGVLVAFFPEPAAGPLADTFEFWGRWLACSALAYLGCAYALLSDPPRWSLPLASDLTDAEMVQSAGRGLDAQVCRAAARGGHVDVLDWAGSVGFVLDVDLLVIAAGAGHANVLEWRFGDYQPADDWTRDQCADAAAHAGHVNVLEWMRARWRHALDTDSCVLAAEAGRVAVLAWAHRRWPWGIDWQAVGVRAVEAGRHDVASWGCHNGIWVA
jgi:hypothetical protein